MRCSIRRPVALAAAALAVTLAPANVARADKWMTKAHAESVTREFVALKYGLYASTIAAYCRPQGRPVARRGIQYDRMACVWYDTDTQLTGKIRIRGIAAKHVYDIKVLRGAAIRG